MNQLEEEVELEQVRIDLSDTNPTNGKMPETSGLHKFKLSSLVVKDLCYDVVHKEGPPWKRKEVSKRILHNINLNLKVGSLTAILGPSGAGKTTLLNFMALRVAEGSKPTGEYLVNNLPGYQLKSYARGISYILQEDVFLPDLTVRETLLTSAKLKLPKTMSEEAKVERVNEVIALLGLGKCADTIVGEPGIEKGISGGEKKRLSIGVELVAHPSVLFVDEPTSGLDTVIAYDVIEVLKSLVEKEGVTVITTIHQPSSEIFKMFDNVLLMKDGRILSYASSEQTMQIFSKNGMECPEHSNPADHLLMVAMDREKINAENLEGVHKNYEETATHEVAQFHSALAGNKKQSDKIVTATSFFNRINTEEEEQLGKEYKTTRPNWFYKFSILFVRAARSALRNPHGIRRTIITSIGMAILIGLIFLRIGDNSQQSIQNREGVLFFLLINLGMNAIQSLLATFQVEKTVFLRENLGRQYAVSEYYFSKLATILPVQLISPVIFVAIAYFMVGFQANFGYWISLVGVVCLICICMNGYGLALSAASKDLSSALTVSPIVLLPQIILCGFFINKDSIPPYLIWVHYLSIFKYGFEIIATNEFTGLTFVCTPSQLVNGTICPVTNGQQVLNGLSIPTVNIANNWGIMLALCFFSMNLGFLALYLRARKYRTTGSI